MIRRYPLAAALALGLIALAFTSSPASAEDLPVLGEGRCFYAEKYAVLREEGVNLADCDAARIDQSGDEAVFVFTHTRRKRETLFRTRRVGDSWQIIAARQQDRAWRDATGACEIYRRDGMVSTVACYTTTGVFRYAANFEVGRGF
ncbi:hypothetical protein EH31_14440 [Erythrobacter longus]|uniref:Uncharacterized protein n=1 Tax=Erythrobacter longus TaxID=1044 RepID=A0A074M3P3_ERYLO|nr:hypothetical protein [Erythrobacter longus]KEO89226.1 hypothetical protein EH31_14440 [Erythrobacter longus]